MRETSIVDNLNCTMQAHPKVWDNKELEEKLNDCPFTKILLKDWSSEATQALFEEMDYRVFTAVMLHSIKVMLLYVFINNACNSWVLASVGETSAKIVD